jgi:hypothetical protein
LAVEGYKISAKKELSKKMKELKNLTDDKFDDFNLYVHAEKPTCHYDDFDTVIGMLKLSIEDTVNITPQEYKQYYLNDWQWKRDWEVSNTNYMMMGAQGLYGSKGVAGKSSKK